MNTTLQPRVEARIQIIRGAKVIPMLIWQSCTVCRLKL